MLFPQMGPDLLGQGQMSTAPFSMGAQHNEFLGQNNQLLGANPLDTVNQIPQMNTTAPSSQNFNPVIQNMVKALKGGT